MEDIFLILIGLLWLAYTFYSKSQKKQKRALRSAEEEGQTNREPSILEQILLGQEVSIPEPEEYVSNYEPEEYVEPVYQKQSQQKPEPQPKPFLNYELSRTRGEGRPAFAPMAYTDKPLEIEHLDFFSTPGFFDEEFNLRNAVIYHEILNPPYIDFK